ncbi:TetR/AcrR family transcriptional regulator [Streptomyces sp. NRRL B-24484]|uniref:TetR/AcrR family transcriptional regulator n=1 Tax=Streptomyces sp. NRRL B-24484 TaxID=1463833 RepID=UPI0004BE73F2|nr:TetR/AcrR family transcriptional regulator [Streptomyces sp. NRRL B-24484]
MDQAEARTRLLDAAGQLFYERGIQAVGVDQIRTASGVSLKRFYQLFPSKSDLVLAYLQRRDARWLDSLTGFADARPAGDGRILAVFDWLHAWFGEPDFRGCAFLNAFGEIGATDPAAAAAVRAHKAALRDYLGGLLRLAGRPESLLDPLFLLAEGAMTTAAVTGSPEVALRARDAAAALLTAAAPAAA